MAEERKDQFQIKMIRMGEILSLLKSKAREGEKTRIRVHILLSEAQERSVAKTTGKGLVKDSGRTFTF